MTARLRVMRIVRRPAWFMLMAVVLLSACRRNGGPTNGAGASPSDSGDQPDSRPAYSGPPVTLDVEAGEDWTQFDWSVRVPTGGWKLTFDGVKTRDDHAIVRIRLERPGPNEIVTQSLETLTGDYRHGTKSFATAELWIMIVTRGDGPGGDDFRVAATWP